MNTMKLSFNEKIMLDSLLYEASKSEEIQQSKKTSRLIFAGMIAVIGLFLMIFNLVLGGSIFLVGGLFFLIYPKYAGYYYKKFYTTVAQGEQFKSSDNNTYDVEFNKEYILMKNTQLEAKHHTDHFEWLSETKENFFIKLNSGSYLIFPKQQVPDIEWLRNYFKEIKIPYHTELDWKWS
ncbi:hypothetical protein BBI01_10510 [Chryseobacterium artocarpi]|uniref:Uncharacterized protein n=1 Tax=Chryseobacterium artocarpi TaxID=1414727 RepID=A0A1B8ZLP9_9FLAO|nr:YcxB family protein [Chryseobacterium artocarpi]OCA72539.1 hypothetical protein BBI01_10510 [Chryseobacterium artocarpi]